MLLVSSELYTYCVEEALGNIKVAVDEGNDVCGTLAAADGELLGGDVVNTGWWLA